MNINNQKGFANIILIAAVIILVGTVGYFALRKLVPQAQITQPETSQQLSGITLNSNNSSQASKISKNVFKNATYHIAYSTGKNETTPKEFTMINGSAKLAEFTVCGIVNVNSKEVLAATIDQRSSKGVVTVYCNYGASATDVFLVAFKNLNGVPVQTGVVDIRKHSVLLSRNLFRVGVKQMFLEPSGVLTVTALVVPEAFRNAPGYQQSATEPVTITYHLDSQGIITE
jgi:hypothetical protein